MSRYIDADNILYKDLSEGRGVCWVTFRDWIKEMPAADVRENVRGEWLDSRANLYDKKHVYKQCSNCGAGFIYGVVMPKRPDGKIPVHTQFHNYCPNCGAQMIRGES